MPAGVTDRAAEVWEPLLMVADLAGGDWPQRAREACTAFVDGARDDTETTGTRLLADLQQVFGDADVQSTETILGELHALEESPWGDWYGKPLNARGLAKLLKPYQVKATQVRIGENTPRGYRRSDLHEAWRSYLPGGSETSTTSATSLASHVLDVADVAHPRQACAGCGEPLDPALAISGDTTHPMCDPAEETTVKLSGRPRPFPKPKPEPAPHQCRICLLVTEDLHKGVCRDRAACEARQPALPKQ
jgi:Protein of unknown function (DUF3631)